MIELLDTNDLDLLITCVYGDIAYCKEILEQSANTDSKYIKGEVTKMELENKIRDYHRVLRKLQFMRNEQG